MSSSPISTALTLVSPSSPPLHHRSGEGRGDESGANLYENFAEATVGKGTVDMTHVLPSGTTEFEEAAEAEENREKELAAQKLTRRSEYRCSSSFGISGQIF